MGYSYGKIKLLSTGRTVMNGFSRLGVARLGFNIGSFTLPLLLLGVGISGCIYNEKTINPVYQPKNVEDIRASVRVNEFIYKRKKDVKENEIKNVGLNHIYINSAVSHFFERALESELAMSGASVTNENQCNVAGIINNFELKTIGYDITFLLNVSYVLIVGSRQVYSRRVDTKMKASKFGGLASFNQTIFININQLLIDKKFVQILEENCS